MTSRLGQPKRAKGQKGQKRQKTGAKKFNKRQKGQNSSNLVLFRIESWGVPIGDLLKIISGEKIGNLAQIRTSHGSSAEVERTFSKLNKMLAKDRNFEVTNIENYICIYCNNTLH